MSANPLHDFTYEELEDMDVITVELIPERKGLILKHCEYLVSSRRHGTTVTRRYNDFVQLYDVLVAKYTYRSICRLPPKRVVVGGGSPLFLQRRQAALQRWLSVVARHPVLAHDADLRIFLCEAHGKLERPKHDEFALAGTQEVGPNDMPVEEMQAMFLSEHEKLRVIHLGLTRLQKIFDKVEERFTAECVDIGELGAALSALSTLQPHIQEAATIANKAIDINTESPIPPLEAWWRVAVSVDALAAWRDLHARLTRGLHAERALASNADTPSGKLLRDRHRYSLMCALHEARITKAYAQSAIKALPELFSRHGETRSHLAALWTSLEKALANKC